MGVVPGRASGSLRRVRGRASTWTASPESIHKDLEEKIAHIHQQKDAILYPSCFDANAGLFEALLTPEDTILSDELNHASIINGIHLCKTHKYRYLHLDMADLEARLQEAQAGQCRGFQGQIGLILSLLPGEGRLGEAKSIMTNSLQV
uniref:Glycine C-acetyltransferase n=1 Tax=Rousettus aegyptiacus TaxID=9407 RepID=A0A7J8JDN7_ROUAE|nr:glycine C-acetyltransferase [Rousettus aegyptiacus]